MAILVLLGGTFGLPSSVTEASELTKDDALERAYNDMLQDLSDPDKAYRYAELAYTAGRLRSAAVALERLLRLKPGAQSIRLQLGTIYYRLGLYGLALADLKEALANAEFPESYASPARAMLADAESRLAVQTFTGDVYVGARYESNVTQSASVNLNAAGLVGSVVGAVQKEDVAAIGGGNFSHVYRFEQPNLEWQTNAVAYGTLQRSQGNYDIGYLTVDSGPFFGVGSIGGDRFSLRPFALLDNFVYGGDELAWGGGGGVTAAVRFPDNSQADITVKTEKRRFYNSPLRPTEAGQTDLFSTLIAQYTASITDNQTIVIGGGGALDNADDRTLANKQLLGRLSYAVVFDGPFTPGTQSWSVRVSENYTASFFDAANPAVSAAVRHDQLSDSTITLTIPVTDSIRLGLNFEYLNNSSSIPSFRFDDKVAFTTVGFHF